MISSISSSSTSSSGGGGGNNSGINTGSGEAHLCS